MRTTSGEITDVQVERRRLFGELPKLGSARVRERAVEEVGEGDHGDDAAPAARACGHRRRVEPARELEQEIGLGAIEADFLAVLVDDSQRGSGRTGSRHVGNVP